MKKMKVLAMAFLSVFFLWGVTCCVNLPIAEQQPNWDFNGEETFEGSWTVSGYQEGGVKTLRYDGETVTIVKRGDVYYIDGPTWFFAETKFKLSRNILDQKRRLYMLWLEGTNIPDLDRLKTNWPALPVQVLSGAYGRVVFKGTLIMRKDNSIAANQNNFRIFYNKAGFHHVEEYPDFYQFTLIRKR